MNTLLNHLFSGESLTRAQARKVMREILTQDLPPEQIGAFLAALRVKGESVEEITGFAEALLSSAIKIPKTSKVLSDPHLIDVCGTGGDHSQTFNISTTVSLVVAASDAKVAKHGNRSVSSQSGSADVLEALGIFQDVAPEAAVASLIRDGIGFFFAPSFYPTLKKVAPIRKNLGVRTVFNLLGPLVNPVRVKKQLVGIYDRRFLEKYALVLKTLGSKECLIVSSEDGLDEISLCAPTHAVYLKNGKLKKLILKPEAFGFKRAKLSALKGGKPQQNAKIIESLLSGQERGPKRDIVLLNAGAALWISGLSKSIEDGIQLATQSIDQGKAKALLESLRR